MRQATVRLTSTLGLLVTLGLAHQSAAAVDVQLVASGIPNLVGIEQPGDDTGRLFLLSQTGRILIYDGTQVRSTPFLDIASIALSGSERGLLGLAFHPHYDANGALYRLVLSAASSPILTVVKTGTGSGRITSTPIALDCGNVCAAQLASGTAVTLSTVPDAGSTFVEWTGDAECTSGSLSLSSNRSCSARFGIAFTDDTITAGLTVIRAVHLTELRTRIDAQRARAGLAAFQWTDPSPTAATTIVKAIHVTELRTALTEAYAASGQAALTYTDPTLAAGQTVKSVHISDLRRAVLLLE